MPPFDIGAFRTNFPEFADTVKYSEPTISFWASLAQAQVRQCIWKTQWNVGVSLYVAHEITIAAQSVKSASVGGVPGTSAGIANNKTVGNVTVQYDANTTTEKDAGYWNQTQYGRQFIRLVRIFGAGAIQL